MTATLTEELDRPLYLKGFTGGEWEESDEDQRIVFPSYVEGNYSPAFFAPYYSMRWIRGTDREFKISRRWIEGRCRRS